LRTTDVSGGLTPAVKHILEHPVATTLQDVVIVFVTVSGRNKGQLVQEAYANKIYDRKPNQFAD
jgi:saccharopine dehydrogenase-like NADP-dependent oxidoreductase